MVTLGEESSIKIQAESGVIAGQKPLKKIRMKLSVELHGKQTDTRIDSRLAWDP